MKTYKATNTLNGKFYIGSTQDFEKRKKQHLSSKANYPFQNALRKSSDFFEWEIVEDDSKDPILEQALLDMWYGTEMCYNLNKYACGGCSGHSEETKQKMSSSHLGRPKSIEQREAMSKGRVGMRFSDTHKENISNSKKGTNHSPWNKGKTWYINVTTHETRMFILDPGEGWIKGRKL